MKKIILLVGSLLVCLLVLTGCSCNHVWTGPDCTTAKTCSECQAIEGEPLGHSWAEAACEAPKTCRVCGETEGEPLGHTWTEATCEAPKTCTSCNKTEGEATGHSWSDWSRVEANVHRICESCGTEDMITMSDYLITLLQGRWISTELWGSDIPPDLFTSFEVRADGTVGLYYPSRTEPSCRLAFDPPLSGSDSTLDEMILGFTITPDGTEHSLDYCFFQHEDFIEGFPALRFERESAEAGAVREMLQGKWTFDSFYAYDDAFAGLDHSGYTVEFHEGNKFTVCAETQLDGTWVYYPGENSESDGVTYYGIIAAVGEDLWSMYFSLGIHNDSGAMLLTVERPRMERTEFVKAETAQVNPSTQKPSP